MPREKETVGHAVRTLNHVVHRNFISAARAAGLDEITVMHGWITGYLYDHADQIVCQRDIEARFSIGRSAVTGVVQCMEGKGLLVRKPVESDGRLKQLRLTEKGRQVHEKTICLIEHLEEELCRGISPEELAAFFETVKKLKHNGKRVEVRE